MPLELADRLKCWHDYFMDRKALWIIFSITFLVLGGSLLTNLVLSAILVTEASTLSLSHEEQAFEEVLLDGDESSDGKIVLIDLQGLISYEVPGNVGNSMVEDIEAQIKQAIEDEDVAAIILNINSPGGEVTASDQIYHSLRECDENEKPVIAYINSVGASGAYYAAMGTRHVMANELSITGSIGVILQSMNYKRFSDFVGLEFLTFKSGKMKDILNPTRDATPEEKAYVQSLIDETYDKFLSIVADQRSLEAEKLRNGMADGRILSGKNALDAGLVDSNGYLKDAFQKAREIAELDADTPVFRYAAPFELGNVLRLFGEQKTSSMKLQIGPGEFPVKSGYLYFLSPHLLGAR